MKKLSVLSLFVFLISSLILGLVFVPNYGSVFAEENSSIVFSKENLPQIYKEKYTEQNYDLAVSEWFTDYVNNFDASNVLDVIELDCDLKLTNFLLSGSIGTKENPFQGSFNGNGHSITNMNFVPNVVENSDNPNTAKTEQNFGLFGVVSGARISNLEIVGKINFKVTNCNPANVGVLCGRAENGSSFEYISMDVAVDMGSTLEEQTDSNSNTACSITGSLSGDFNVNFGLLAGVVQDSNIDNVVCRLSRMESVSFSSDENTTSNFGGVVGDFDNSKLHFAVVQTNLRLNVLENFVGKVSVGGVVGNVQNFGSEIINVAVENSMQITFPTEGQAEVLVGDVVGKVDGSLTPKAGRISNIHFKKNTSISAFGSSGQYVISREENITETAQDLSLSNLISDNNGSYTYFTASSQGWNTIEIGNWNFKTVWFVNSGKIYLQAFADEFRVSFNNLDSSVLKLNTPLASTYHFGEMVEFEFEFAIVLDADVTINMHDFYSITAIELADRDVAKIEDNKTSYRVTSGADLYDVRAKDNGFVLVIRKMNLNTSGNYNIKTTWNDFSIAVGTELYEKGVPIEGNPAYVYYGINDEMESFTLPAIKYGDEATIFQRAKLNEPVAFMGWYVLKGDDVIDLHESGESLTFTFGKGVFNENCQIVARYSRDACDVVFNMDDGVLRIVCNGNTITSTNQTFALPKNKQDLKLEIYIKNGYGFNTEEFIEFMDTFKSSGTAFCTLREDYEVDDGHYYHFDLDMTTLYGDYASNFTIDTKTARIDTANNSWIWIVVGVVGGAVVLGVVIFLIVFFAKRRSGFGGRMGGSGKVSKKSYKNLYY